MEGYEYDARMPIILHIASPGGDMNIMQLVYDVIIKSTTPIYTINESYAHSGAFLIFLAGHKRFMRKMATFIAHEGSIYLGGNHKESREAMKRYEQEVKDMIGLIASRTALTTEEIDEHFSNESDWYITYDQALEKGILTDPGLPEPNRYPIRPKIEEVTKLDVTLKTDEKENTNV
jgi:ATP-dependent Clp protease protease subunit